MRVRADAARFAIVNDVPELHIVAGRYQSTCGKCLRNSVLVRADDPGRAWTELLKVGWAFYTPPTVTVRGYARCPTCTASPETIDDAVAAAKRSASPSVGGAPSQRQTAPRSRALS